MNTIRSLFTVIFAVAISFVLACGTAVVPAEAQGPSNKSGIEWRWLNNASFELILPSGAHVLVDPWLSCDFAPVSINLIERADYILLSHIHGDHAADVRAIQLKFPDVRIFVGQMSAESLAKTQGLNFNRIYKVSDGRTFQFDDVKIQTFAGRHTEGRKGNYGKWDATTQELGQGWGAFDLYHYLITAPDGTSFMVWAGSPSVDDAYALAGLKPDLLAAHISPKQDYSVLGRIINSIGPVVWIGHHYDMWPSALSWARGEFPPELQDQLAPGNVIEVTFAYINAKLRAAGTQEALLPARMTWYPLNHHSDPLNVGFGFGFGSDSLNVRSDSDPGRRFEYGFGF